MVSFFGNVVRDVSKVVLDGAEKVADVSGAGKAVEAMGVHVNSNIHDNGLGAQVTGPAAIVFSGGEVDRAEMNIKAKSGGGDFGAKAEGEGKKNDVSLYRFSAEADTKGFAASCAKGIVSKSGFMRVTSVDDVERVVKTTINKLSEQDPTRISESIIKATGAEPEKYIEVVTSVVF